VSNRYCMIYCLARYFYNLISLKWRLSICMSEHIKKNRLLSFWSYNSKISLACNDALVKHINEFNDFIFRLILHVYSAKKIKKKFSLHSPSKESRYVFEDYFLTVIWKTQTDPAPQNSELRWWYHPTGRVLLH